MDYEWFRSWSGQGPRDGCLQLEEIDRDCAVPTGDPDLDCQSMCPRRRGAANISEREWVK